MYEKQLLNRKIRYFRYAPPMTRLDDTTDDDRPKAPFAGAPVNFHAKVSRVFHREVSHL